jgi:uncharacterized protein YjcR
MATPPKMYKNKDWLHVMYVVRELEVWEIAELGGTSTKMIHEWLQKYEFYSMDELEFIDPHENLKNYKN